jgi:DNA-binding NarL/FixJ family response regulator
MNKIRVAILDDHQSIIDGYRYRLSNERDIEVVASACYGSDLEPMLSKQPTDVLLLDIAVPIAEDDLNPYPVLHILPRLLQLYPDLNVLVGQLACRMPFLNQVLFGSNRAMSAGS